MEWHWWAPIMTRWNLRSTVHGPRLCQWWASIMTRWNAYGTIVSQDSARTFGNRLRCPIFVVAITMSSARPPSNVA
jgi:hypothetical protein